ncbi:hypothetical protein BG006_009777 [Podila minutissima]|uniref:Uncharacterized protein n=1 Tax=Podila minutissima TaxID=64525 RepID=A0A9P5VPZ8_9FUNG|nr:hypothetical protein BG006_009777 [Podila minutissima]
MDPPPPSGRGIVNNEQSQRQSQQVDQEQGMRPIRVGSRLLQSVSVTVPTFSKELDLGTIANPTKHSTIKQYLFASLLFKSPCALFLDCFSLVFLSGWSNSSVGKGNLIVYALATTGSILIVGYGGWRAFKVLKKGHIQDVFVNREAYRWVCLTSRDRFLFFERVGQGYGPMDALVFFAWFTLRDWMQHLLCDLTRLIINCTILAQVAYQKSLKEQNLPPTQTLPDLSGISNAAIVVNIMLHICNLTQFIGAGVVLFMVWRGKLVALRKDEQLHSYCQRNLTVRIGRLYKLAKHQGTTAPLRDNNQLEQQMNQYRRDEEAGVEGGIDLGLAALAWDTETTDDHLDYNHYAYRPRPISHGPPSRAQLAKEGSSEQMELTEKTRPMSYQPPSQSSSFSFSQPAPVPGSFSHAQMEHLKQQREKYGDNKELYEIMEWVPPIPKNEVSGAPPMSFNSHPPQTSYVSPPMQQNQYRPPPPSSSQPQYDTMRPPPIPRKEF